MRTGFVRAMALTAAGLLACGTSHAQVGAYHVYTIPNTRPIIYVAIKPDCAPDDGKAPRGHAQLAAHDAQAAYTAGKRESAFICAVLAAHKGDAMGEEVLGTLYTPPPASDDIGAEPISGFYDDSEAGLYWLQKASDDGDGMAALYLGALYDVGQGVPQSDDKAAQAYQRAIALGVGRAKTALATLQTRPAREKAFADPLTAKARQGNATAARTLGEAYGHGIRLQRNYAAANAWLSQAAEAGDREAQAELGLLYRDGLGTAQDPNQAADWILKAGANDYHNYDWVVAELYDSGQLDPGRRAAVAARGQAGKLKYNYGARIVLDDTPQNVVAATGQKATTNNDLAGVMALNDSHAQSPQTKPATPASADLTPGQQLTMANAGDAAAQFYVGQRYLSGNGVVSDPVVARQWFEKAAASNLPDAEINLGDLYYAGNGVTQDYAQALAWYQKAAAQGDEDGRFNVGIMLDKGLGAAPDPVTAYACAIYLKTRKDPRAHGMLANLTPRTSYDQQAQAVSLVAQWSLAHYPK